jgi:F-type H+-transporting ATPase subunit epsilon
MTTLHLEIVTVERKLFDDQVDMVVVPGSEGVLGILPHHTALLTALTFGELVVKKEGEPDQFFAVGGGFMEVQPDHVVVLADSAERADEIDLSRAEEARKRAQARLQSVKDSGADFGNAEAALRRSLTRLRVARRRRREAKGGYGGPPGPSGRDSN